jgi:hypothetical protein
MGVIINMRMENYETSREASVVSNHPNVIINNPYMRVKYDLLSTTIGKNFVFNKPKECIQMSKFKDSKSRLHQRQLKLTVG